MPFFLPEFTNVIDRATLFNVGSNIKFKQQEEGTFIYLKNIKEDQVDTIIKIELK